MLTINNVSPDFLTPMKRYQEWVFSNGIQSQIEKILSPQNHKLELADHLCSETYLMGIDHQKHSGLPADFLGINLNSKVIKQHIGQIDAGFINEAREKSDELDAALQDLLGAKLCALKMYYPKGGYIDWHTNWDNPGYNIIFTYSKNGDGYWRHIDAKNSASVVPNYDNMVQIDDHPGWNCKAGYFGSQSEHKRLLWHCAYTQEPRLTLSYIIYDQALWENLVDELKEGEAHVR